MKNVLVTGGQGFIGCHLVEELKKKGCSVKTFDLKGCQDVKENLDKYDLDNFDTVFHLAALRGVPDSFLEPANYFLTNVWGTYNILTKFKNVRVLNTSSSSAIKKLSPYAMTKACSELMAESFQNTVTVRPFNVFGQRQLTDMAIPSFIRNALIDRPSIIYGDGSITRDWTYVGDVVKEMIWYAESNFDGVYDMGYSEERSVKEILETINSYYGCTKEPIYSPGRSGDQKRSRSIEGFHVKIDGFDKGLKKTMKWFKENYYKGENIGGYFEEG